MMKFLVLILVVFISFLGRGQNVSIYVYSAGVGIPAVGLYEPFFGVGNVNVTSGGPIADYSPYDIVLFNAWGAGFAAADVTNLVSYIQGGGHVCLSTEGASVVGGGRFMSSVWNALTGQNITETGAGASGTNSPPRFHNSNGPWGLSPDVSLKGSTTSYASFFGFSPENVTHQRTTTAPSCGDIQGLSAVYPARPNLGDGTLYIQGEIQYPYGNLLNSTEVDMHASALAEMHHTLLTNNQARLTQLNTWQANYVIDEDILNGGQDIEACFDGASYSLTAPTGYDTYLWNTGATTETISVTQSGTYSILTSGTLPMCDGIDTIEVLLHMPAVSKFKSDTVCLGTVTTFTNQSTIADPETIASYLWNFGDGNTDATENPTHTFLTEGNHSVNLKVTSTYGCEHDTTITVVVNAQPTASFTTVDDCVYSAAVFTDASSISSGSITEWNWNFGDVMPVTTIQSTDQNPTYSYPTSTISNYLVTLSIKSDEGCEATFSSSSNRFFKPEINVVALPDCEGEEITFTNTSVADFSHINYNSWVWSYGDGTALESSENGTHTYTASGYYNVTLISSTSDGCVDDTVFQNLYVYPIPDAQFVATSVCVNAGATNFINMSTVQGGTIDSYSWDFGDGVGTSTSLIPMYSYETAGIYDVVLEVTSNYGCTNEVTSQAQVYEKPEAAFTATSPEGCTGLCIDFSDNSTSNATSINSYFWIFGNGQVFTEETPTICLDNISHTIDDVFDVRLIVSNDLGCKDTVLESDYITIHPNPLAVFEADPMETNMYFSEIDYTNLSEGGETYSWSYGDGEESTVFEEQHVFADTGSYVSSLIVTTEFGCKDTIDTLVRINPVLNVYVPSAFTPNNDGVNDVFFVKGFAIEEKGFSFSVFDRWGLLIYHTEKFVGWDGTYKGIPSPDDVYIYQVTLKDFEGKPQEYKGHFTLLR